jgi:5-methylcytosine-specific restriction endonuclease McrA
MPKKSKKQPQPDCNSYATPIPLPTWHQTSTVSDYPKRTKFASAYFEKLNDPRWQRKRLKIMDRDSFTCQKCGSDKKKLNVHHEYYISKRDPWAYPDSALTTLCEPCHSLERKSDGDYTPNSIRDWEALLETFVPCGEYLDFCAEFSALVKRSGKSRAQVLTWLMHNINGECRGPNA